MPIKTQALDLLSTSQTRPEICPFGAPFVALIIDGAPRILQTCCNHWECPVCGLVRARQEYRRIVHGCEVLSVEHKLYFWTLTCRGREISLAKAEANYYAWTNVLLTNARTKATRAKLFWAYVQVTERQHKNRAHPHSHIITTFLPNDAVLTKDANGGDAYISPWFSRANSSSGLGEQHRITLVKSASAVSRYVAKYMFKDTMTETFPPKWKRVRYSQNFPKSPVLVADIAIVLTDKSMWRAADEMPVNWVVNSITMYEICRHRIGRVRLEVNGEKRITSDMVYNEIG